MSAARRRRSWSFAKSLGGVVLLGAILGVCAHYGYNSGVFEGALKRVQTAATSDRPSHAYQHELANASTAIHFDLCSGSPRFTCVVDGDTIWLEGEKIRIADIDAPEVFSPKCDSEKALGDRATLRLLALVNAGAFKLKDWPGRNRDRYGRLLRVLVRNGRSLGDILVAEGLARTWTGRREPWC